MLSILLKGKGSRLDEALVASCSWRGIRNAMAPFGSLGPGMSAISHADRGREGLTKRELGKGGALYVLADPSPANLGQPPPPPVRPCLAAPIILRPPIRHSHVRRSFERSLEYHVPR